MGMLESVGGFLKNNWFSIVVIVLVFLLFGMLNNRPIEVTGLKEFSSRMDNVLNEAIEEMEKQKEKQIKEIKAEKSSSESSEPGPSEPLEPDLPATPAKSDPPVLKPVESAPSDASAASLKSLEDTIATMLEDQEKRLMQQMSEQLEKHSAYVDERLEREPALLAKRQDSARIIEQLERDPDSVKRQEAARVLAGHTKGIVVVKLIEALIKDSSPEVKTEAVRSLGFVANEHYLPVLEAVVQQAPPGSEILKVAEESIAKIEYRLTKHGRQDPPPIPLAEDRRINSMFQSRPTPPTIPEYGPPAVLEYGP